MVDRVVVRVPATIANLGPGFDVLGCAIAWHNEITVERGDALQITATGLGADAIARDRTNLVVRALEAVAGEQSGLRIHQMIGIAFGRGFGSSAAAIVGGLLAGRALGETAHSDAELLRLAIEIEGHADNVAPCLLGGVTVSAGGRTIRLEPPRSIRPLVCVAPTRLSTEVARGALPERFTRAEAVQNLGAAALLTAALASGDVDALMEATEDLLHQPARFGLMPDSADLVRGLRAKGVAAFLSGAGPSVAALVPAGRIEAATEAARALVLEAWDVRSESFDIAGAAVIDQR